MAIAYVPAPARDGRVRSARSHPAADPRVPQNRVPPRGSRPRAPLCPPARGGGTAARPQSRRDGFVLGYVRNETWVPFGFHLGQM